MQKNFQFPLFAVVTCSKVLYPQVKNLFDIKVLLKGINFSGSLRGHVHIHVATHNVESTFLVGWWVVFDVICGNMNIWPGINGSEVFIKCGRMPRSTLSEVGGWVKSKSADSTLCVATWIWTCPLPNTRTAPTAQFYEIAVLICKLKKHFIWQEETLFFKFL